MLYKPLNLTHCVPYSGIINKLQTNAFLTSTVVDALYHRLIPLKSSKNHLSKWLISEFDSQFTKLCMFVYLRRSLYTLRVKKLAIVRNFVCMGI